MIGVYEERQTIDSAIKKAVANGYSPRPDWDDLDPLLYDLWQYGLKKVTWFSGTGSRVAVPVYELIFSPNFGRALWGEKLRLYAVHTDASGDHQYGLRPVEVQQRTWKHHLQQMVIAEDPIVYLREHLG